MNQKYKHHLSKLKTAMLPFRIQNFQIQFLDENCCILNHISQNMVFSGKDSRYKLFWTGNKGRCGYPPHRVLGGKRILRGSHLRWDHPLKISNGQEYLYYSCLYPPAWAQWSRNSYVTDSYSLEWSDWNGHACNSCARYEKVYGGHNWGTRNTEGGRLLKFALFCDLVIGNACF